MLEKLLKQRRLKSVATREKDEGKKETEGHSLAVNKILAAMSPQGENFSVLLMKIDRKVFSQKNKRKWQMPVISCRDMNT